jgi:hypothetical protein
MLTLAQYFSGQGRILVAKRLATGRPGAFSLLADCSSAKLELKVDQENIQESMSGERLVAKVLDKAKSATLTVTCKQFSKTSVALGFYSDPLSIVAGSVTGEAFPLDLAAGDEIGLNYGNVSDLVITDSTGTPLTMTKDTQYAENSLVFGNVGILQDAATGGYTEPLLAAYSYAAADSFPMFSKTPEERYIRIEGLNTAEDDAPVLIEMYNGKAAPFSSVDWISDSASNQDIPFNLLYDPLNATNANYGKFGRVTFL